MLTLIGCKKEEVNEVNINPEEVRLKSIETHDASGAVTEVNFIYDEKQRIFQLHSGWIGQIHQILLKVNYAGSETILYRLTLENETDEIRYLLNTSGQATRRVEAHTMEYKFPDEPQRDFMNDTTYYEYDADGLLRKAWGRRRDSTWVNPGIIHTVVTITDYTSEYSNINKNLGALITQKNKSSVSKNGNILVNSKSSVEEKIQFTYDKGYLNKTDFKNAFILTEFGGFSGLGYPFKVMGYPINVNYQNYPDKIVSTVTNRDESGTVTSMNTDTQNMILDFNKYGFISLVNYNPTEPYHPVIRYNK